MPADAVQPISTENLNIPARNTALFNNDRINISILVLSSLSLFFIGLANCGLIDPGDGYFSETAREMIERNDYVVPYLNYQIYFSKPILIYWLIIGAYKVLGVTEFAARFWSAALATAMVVSTYWTVRSIVSKRAGMLAALVFASAPLVVTFARMALIDMGFACLLGFALCATAMTLFTSSRKWWPWIYISLALSVLDKGPAGLALYLVGVAGPAIVFKRTVKEKVELLKKLNLLLGIPLFALIATPWYLAVGLATNWLWPQVFFFFENVGRFAGHTNHRNPAIWFYLPVLAYGFFPWMLFLPKALLDAGKAIAHTEQTANFSNERVRGLFLLAAGWAVGVLALFSLSMTKLQTYILPAFPAMAIAIGIMLDRSINESETSASKPKSLSLLIAGALLTLVGAGSALATIAGLLLGTDPASALKIAISNHLVPVSAQLKLAPLVEIISSTEVWMRAGLLLMTTVMAVGLSLSGRWLMTGRGKSIEQGLAVLGITTVLSCSIGAPIAFQLGYKYKDCDVQSISAVLSDKPGPVALFGDFKPALIWHLRRPVDTIFSCEQLHHREPGEPAVQYIIAGRKGASQIISQYQGMVKTIAHKGDWYVFESHELIALRLPTLERSFKEHIDLSGGDFSWGTLPFAGGTK